MVLGLAALPLLGCSSDDAAVVTTTTAAPSTTTAAPFAGDADSPFCDLLANLDTSQLLAGDSQDPEAVQAALVRLVGVLREAHALAPPDIEQDLELVRAGIEALDTALSAVGYDLKKLSDSGRGSLVTQSLSDPVFTAAGGRLGLYRTDVCKL